MTYKGVHQEVGALHDSKRDSYSPGQEEYANYKEAGRFTCGASNYVLGRMAEKQVRLGNLKGQKQKRGELLDIANLAIIAIDLLDEEIRTSEST